MNRALVVLLSALVLAGCGARRVDVQSSVAPAATMPSEPTPDPGFDPEDPAIDTVPEDEADIDRLVRQAGKRPDFRIPRSVAAGLQPGPLTLAVVARPFFDVADDKVALHQLNPEQFALYALYTADYEILNGGFSQMWGNLSPGLTNQLADLAQRVGSPEYAAIYRDAQALWPGGKVPVDQNQREDGIDALDADGLAAIDARYADTQYHRRTALGLVLGRYIRAHEDRFLAG